MTTRATLIYDGECGMCRRAIEWIRGNELPGALEYLTCQSDERADRFPSIVESQCLEAMQLVLPDGTIYAGDRSLPHLFLRMRRWQWFARFFRLPVVSLLTPICYRFVARHRYAISVLVAKKHNDDGAQCSVDRACE